MAPLVLKGTAAAALAALAKIVAQTPGARVVSQTENYLHAEFATAVLGFVDDVEFLVNEAGGVIHFRSASRVGYWDLGANRRRMEGIRRAWEML